MTWQATTGGSQALRPATEPVPLTQVVHGLATVSPATAAVEVRGVSLDSRLVQPGDLYVALPGTAAHGVDFIPGALAAGAVALLTDRAGRERMANCTVPVAVADDLRGAMARAAARIYRHPAEALTMLGITGTNGKTTTMSLLSSALQGCGHHVGSVGTLGFQLDGADLGGARTTVTTPESVDLHGLLGLMRERGADTVAMEVSSHAMALRRTEPIRFDVAAFTNLSPEHLDFHATMADYFEAKAMLFTPEHSAAAVINIDDEAGARLAERARGGGIELRTLSWDGAADYRIRSAAGGRVHFTGPNGAVEFGLALPGDFNVRNAVTALAMIELAGWDVAAAAEQLARVTVPGRMQPVGLPSDGPAVFVDFAHTPEAVRSALAAFEPDRARGRRVFAVLGCGGDRDRVKRGPMGESAAGAADYVVVTDDNPRSEDPAAIRAAVLAGARTVLDADHAVDGGGRREAIRHALAAAGPDDVVVVLGKGHEQGQDIDGRIIPFDDATVIVEEWSGLEGNR